MAKARSSYVCQNCGAITQRWQGKCECLRRVEHHHRGSAPRSASARAAARRGARGPPVPARRSARRLASRRRASSPASASSTGSRAAASSPGSATLIGGEPGIGKSTLLIQACAALARRGGRVVYVSGEESTEQVRLRAARLGLADAPVQLAAQTADRGHRRDARLRRRAEIRHHRFDPDHVERRDRIRAGHGQPGARRRRRR